VEAELDAIAVALHGLRVGHTVRLLTTQYVWKYDEDVNTHRYVSFPPGTECVIHAFLPRHDCMIVQACVRVVGTKEKLKMSPTVLERV
jgi:hypothetical protein